MVVNSGTRIVASVSGSFDWVKAPDTLAAYVREKLQRFGQVVSVEVSSGLFASSYVADVVYVTGQAHRSAEDVRATVAGVFQSWNGKRPAVALVEPLGEKAAGSSGSPFLPAGLGNFDPSKYAGLLWALAAVVVVINVAPLLRSR